MVDISVESVLRCDPSPPNFLVCLLLAGSVMWVFMKLIAKAVLAVLSRSPKDVKDRILSDIITDIKNEQYGDMIIKGFNKWAKDNPDKASGIKDDKTIEEFLSDGDFGSRDKAIDAYMESPSRRDVWTECAMIGQADGLSMSMQHIVSGLVGLYALLMVTDQDSFLTIARWGVLLEAGWELFDTVLIHIPPLFSGNFGFGNALMLFHHVTLYVAYWINASFLPSKIGRDVLLALFLYTSLSSVQPPVLFVKKFVDIDLSEKKGRIVYMTISSISIFTFLLPRSVHWYPFAYTLLSFAWDEGVSKPLFTFYVLLVIIFSLFNLPVCYWTYKGFVKAIKKVRAAAKEEKEDAKLRQTRRRRSSLMDANRTSGSTAGRLSSRKSIAVFGVDFELDDDEDIGTVNGGKKQQ